MVFPDPTVGDCLVVQWRQQVWSGALAGAFFALGFVAVNQIVMVLSFLVAFGMSYNNGKRWDVALPKEIKQPRATRAARFFIAVVLGEGLFFLNMGINGAFLLGLSAISAIGVVFWNWQRIWFSGEISLAAATVSVVLISIPAFIVGAKWLYAGYRRGVPVVCEACRTEGCRGDRACGR